MDKGGVTTEQMLSEANEVISAYPHFTPCKDLYATYTHRHTQPDRYNLMVLLFKSHKSRNPPSVTANNLNKIPISLGNIEKESKAHF